MAVSLKDLFSLNVVVFDMNFNVLNAKLEFFYTMVRTLFDELPYDKSVFRSVIDRVHKEITANVEAVKQCFYEKRRGIHTEINAVPPSWSSYKHMVAKIEQEKNETLHYCLGVHSTGLSVLANELFVVLPREDIITDIIVLAKELLRTRFC